MGYVDYVRCILLVTLDQVDICMTIQKARKNILRSHTTGNSMRHLYELAKKVYLRCVFRNEALDATHLAEFNQIEGATYNPYTEPSMVAFGNHIQTKACMEIGWYV